MKLFTTLLTATLLLLASAVSAQNSFPDPNDAACWQSLDALHDCAQAQQDRATSQAERCTSYPEYQCEPESTQAQHVTTEARLQKQKVKAASKAAQPRNNSVDNSGGEAVIIQSPAN